MWGSVDGVVSVFERAQRAAITRQADPSGDMPGSPNASYFGYLWTGLESRKEWAGSGDVEDARRMLEVLDRLDADVLRTVLAQAAWELHRCGWTVPVEDEPWDA